MVDICRDFSRTPGPRKIKDGPYSGEKFYKTVLAPAFENHEKIIVILDGTEGYGSSFIDEAFRNLVIQSGLSLREIKSRLSFVSNEDELYSEDAWDSIEKAARSEGRL